MIPKNKYVQNIYSSGTPRSLIDGSLTGSFVAGGLELIRTKAGRWGNRLDADWWKFEGYEPRRNEVGCETSGSGRNGTECFGGPEYCIFGLGEELE